MSDVSPIPMPLVIEPAELEQYLADDLVSQSLLIVDLSNPDSYQRMHIPGAVHCGYPSIITSRPPVMGLVPDAASLSQVFSTLGLTPDTHVVAYDDEGNGKASRLLYTLHCLGHYHTSLLNGGINAWAGEGHALESGFNQPEASEYRAVLQPLEQAPIANSEYILSKINDDHTQIVDTRSAGEYSGVDLRAARGGHIPGAINFDWTEAMDRQRNLRHQPKEALLAMLAERGITPERPVILYCQTHHRSAHTYVALKHIGFEDVRGYPGAWSEWGNATDLPIE